MGDAAEPLGVTAAALAGWIGVHERTIRDLAERGLVVKQRRGVYDLKASILKYTAHLRDIAANRTGDEKTNLDLTEQRARLAKEQADHTAIKNASLRKELIEAVDAERRWAGQIMNLRARMLAIPSNLPHRLSHLSKFDLSEIDHEIRSAMTEIALGPD